MRRTASHPHKTKKRETKHYASRLIVPYLAPLCESGTQHARHYAANSFLTHKTKRAKQRNEA
jgi:hypothetical protein